MWKKLGVEGRRIPWLSKDLLVKLKHKREGNCLGGGSRGMNTENNIGILPGNVQMRSGTPRHSWSKFGKGCVDE